MATEQRRMSDIESELGDNRERIGQTLNALQQRVSTENLAERGRAYLRVAGGDEFVSNLARSASRNPMPLTLLGVGIGWLMLSSSERAGRAIERNRPDLSRGYDQGSRVRDAATSAGGRAKSAARDLSRQAGQAKSSGQAHLGQVSDSAQRGAAQLADNTRRGAARVGEATRRGGTRVADGAGYMYREQPLVTTGLGLALGAIVAATLPRSRSENRAMGSARDDFVASAQEAGQEKAGQAQSVAESAADGAREAARSEANRQGYSRASDRDTAHDEPGRR